MTDVFTEKKRSEIMSNIRGKDTKPEMKLRKALHRLGFRYRLHDKNLPGKPDLKLTKFNAIIQIHGCFWHGHNCHLFRLPKSKQSYWKPKIEGNRERDAINNKGILDKGWRLLIVWECALKGKSKLEIGHLLQEIESWILNGNKFLEIKGQP